MSSRGKITLVKWPTANVSPFEKAVNVYKNIINNTHKKINTISDVEKYWGVYSNGAGLFYIIRKTGDVNEKVKSYSRSWSLGTKLSKNLAGKVSPVQERNIKDYFNIPNKYGGICPFVESDLELGARAGAYASATVIGNVPTTLVFSLYPIRPNEIPAGNTIADKRFGIFIHELSHVACLSGACTGLDNTGHGGQQVTIDDKLRDISAEMGLKPHNPKPPITITGTVLRILKPGTIQLRYTTPDKKVIVVVKTIGGVYKKNGKVPVVLEGRAPYKFIGIRKPL
jgi:hypothetical protein